ncbi:MAG: nitroreductase family protein [Deltaproteobacteria bacterium]|jgi:nitroreductase|nr:nitroreductase family protein [Deltaproteobacteria bacterium]MCL5880427.1 nitroreductase family protein [Deltaproteobacteria bacterium]MDA8303645.1 nitroreductase family protein [Deltaproteobacteria bacterium]
MDLTLAIETRKSIRKFKKEDVDVNQIMKIIEIASNSPSGGNSQNWFTYIIKDKDVLDGMRNEVEKVYKTLIEKEAPGVYTFFNDAPVVLAVVEKPYAGSIDNILEKTDKDRNYTRKFIVNPGLQSVSSFITHILLLCHNEGLGACWMTGPLIAKQELEDIIGVKSPDNLVALIPIGKPVERNSKTPRKNVSEIIKVI